MTRAWEKFGTDATQVCGLEERAERRVEPGDETVTMNEAVLLGGLGLCAPGGAREVG